MTYRSTLDRILLWGIVVSLIVAALLPRLLRFDTTSAVVGWSAAITASIVLFASTSQAKPFLTYVKQSYNEWQKINWSSRTETTQLSIIVVIAVAIISIALSLFDNLLNWLFQLLTK